jgi:hypothetical protein
MRRKEMSLVLCVVVLVVLVACASGPHRSVLQIQPDPGKIAVSQEETAMAYSKALETGVDMGFRVTAASRDQGTMSLHRVRSTDMVPEIITVDIVNKGAVADVNIAYESPTPLPDVTLKEFTDKLSDKLSYRPAKALTPVAPGRTPAPAGQSGPGQVRTDTAETSFVVLLKNSNVRAEPNTRSKIIVTLRKGEKLAKIGDSGTWVNVRLPSGETGWILKSLVKEAD